MVLYKKENILLNKFQGIELEATFYKPTNNKYKATVLYFHGGGFIFGHREDLPDSYIEMFAKNGYGLLAVDYPLAPEMKLADIIESTKKTINWLTNTFLNTLNTKDYFIMGRSAGGFLALTSGSYATEYSSVKPLGIISFYGYFNLNDASFSVPSRYYLQYPEINERMVQYLVKKEPTVNDLNQARFPIYLASRQEGNWMDIILNSPKQKKQYSLSHEQIKVLPELFIATSTKDPDVPSRQSRQLANIHPNSDLHLINIDEHDFDRTHIKEHGLPLYTNLIKWMIQKN